MIRAARFAAAVGMRTHTRAWARPASATSSLWAQRLQQVQSMRMFSGSLPDHIELPMPALSPTMTQGTIVSWDVAEGGAVSAGDSIAQVGTDKATIPFEATEDGFMAKILVQEGTEDVPVGKIVAIMVDEEDDVAAFKDYVPSDTAPAAEAAPADDTAEPDAAETTPPPPPKAAATPAASAPSTGDRVVASPFARKVARDAGLDISVLASKGTGPNGRIVADDVTAYLESAPAEADESTAAAAATEQQAAAGGDAGAYARGAFQDVPHTAMRRVIAERLTESKRTVPHYSLTSEIKLDALLALRKQLNGDVDGSLSVNDFLIKAAALALRKVPAVNSSWLDSVVRSYDYVDISVAVAVDNGLVTPIVKDADKLGLAGISSNVRDLATRARDNKLKPDEYQGGTFTISNLGMFGIKHFTAIINPPQACILAIGAAEKRVVPNPDPEAETPYASSTILAATLSCDHRVVDGAVGAEWLAAFRGYLENPTTMML